MNIRVSSDAALAICVVALLVGIGFGEYIDAVQKGKAAASCNALKVEAVKAGLKGSDIPKCANEF